MNSRRPALVALAAMAMLGAGAMPDFSEAGEDDRPRPRGWAPHPHPYTPPPPAPDDQANIDAAERKRARKAAAVLKVARRSA